MQLLHIHCFLQPGCFQNTAHLVLIELMKTSKQYYNHRIIESLRLEKASKVNMSNHHPNTTMPTKPCPEVPHRNVF